MIDQESDNDAPEADSAAVFAAALSLWQAIHGAAEKDPALNLSEVFNGIDQMMREAMRIAERFEGWACQHVMFEELEDVWPYRLQEYFGDACLKLVRLHGLTDFDDRDCLRLALKMRLPVKLRDGLRVPIDVHALNPIPDSIFCQFRIQTVRDHIEDGDVHLFCSGDEPFDNNLTESYFALYGVDIDGVSEHLANRQTYREISVLMRKILPDVCFPEFPTST